MPAEPRFEQDAEAGLLRWCNAGLEASLLYGLLAAWSRPREGPAALLPLAACLAIPAALALRQALESTTVPSAIRRTAVIVSALAWALTAARLAAPSGYWDAEAPRAMLVASAIFGGPIPAGHQPLAFWAGLVLWWRGHMLLEWLPSVDDALGRFWLGGLGVAATVALAALPEEAAARRNSQIEQLLAVASFFAFAALTTGLSRRREMAGGAPAAPTIANGAAVSMPRRSLAPLLMILAALVALAIAGWGAESVTPALLAPFVNLGGELLRALGAGLLTLVQFVASLWPTLPPPPPSERPPAATPGPGESINLPHLALPSWIGPLVAVMFMLAGLAMVAHLFILAARTWFDFSSSTISAVSGQGDGVERGPPAPNAPIAILAVLLRLFRSVLHRPAARTATAAGTPAGTGADPDLTSIRAAYRELLAWAATAGWPRRVEETPDEFRRRLVGLCPQVGPEATLLTTLYVAARYGGRACPRPDLRRAQLAVGRLKERRQRAGAGSNPAPAPADRDDPV